MNEHEVYPGAPVVLVALEVRHPESEPLTAAERRAVKAELAKVAPVMKLAQFGTMQVNPANPAQAATTTVEEFPRYLSRDSTLIISMRSTSMTVESTLYKGWDHFRSVIRLALDARRQVSPVDGVERVGIRYVNEIRAPEDVGIDWTEWTQATLQAPRVQEEYPIDLPLALWQGLVVYGRQPGRAVLMRYGPQIGHAVQTDQTDIRFKSTRSGEFFLVDLDSYWVPEEGVPEFDPDVLERTCDDLHGPVRSLFEGSVTNRYREEVLSRDSVVPTA